jgi:hypothetical protein
MFSLSSRWMCLRLAPLLTLPVWLGCEVGKTETRPTCADLAQGLGGMAGNAPGAGAGGTVYTTPLVMTPLNLALPPDPGPQCLDCKQASDIEHVVVADFEDGYAPAWFGFDEQQFAREPQATPAGQPNEPPYWGLHVADLASSPARPRCGSSYALRLQGGPYSQWGGGVGTSYFRLKGAHIAAYCPPELIGITDPGLPQDECGFAIAPTYTLPSSSDPLFTARRTLTRTAWGKSIAGFDASQFDGVAFYARHAPGSTASLQIAIEDFNTSDAAAKTAQIEALTGDQAPDQRLLNGRQPACTRAKECCGNTALADGARPRCNLVDLLYDANVNAYGYCILNETTQLCEPPVEAPRTVTEYRCYVADRDGPPPRRVVEVQAPAAARPVNPTPAELEAWARYDEWVLWNTWNSKHPLCCPNDFEDPQFGKSPLASTVRETQKECVPYVVEGNFENAGTQYCWDPGDAPIPPVDGNRCGDSFRKFVTLSGEWTLFRVPWSELRRSTVGKPAIDPSSIWAISFYWRQGMLDTYIDDFGFYKKRQP